MKTTLRLTYRYPISLFEVQVTGQSISELIDLEQYHCIKPNEQYIRNIPHRHDPYVFIGGIWSPRENMLIEEFERRLGLISVIRKGHVLRPRGATPQELLSFVSKQSLGDATNIVSFHKDRTIIHDARLPKHHKVLSCGQRYKNEHTSLCSYLLVFEPVTTQ